MSPFRSKPEHAALDPHAFAPLQDGWEYTAIPVLDMSEHLEDGTPICFQGTTKGGLEALKRLGLEPLSPDDIEFLHTEAAAGRCIELPAFTGTPTAETSLAARRVSDAANWNAARAAGWKPGMRLTNWGKIIVDGDGRPVDGMWIMGWWVPDLALFTPAPGTAGHRSGPGFIQPRPTPGRARHGIDDQADDGTNLLGKRRVGPNSKRWLGDVFISIGDALSTATKTAAAFLEGLQAGMAPIEGIDVSGHQQPIDWDAVSYAGIEFVYVKATEGTGYVDKRAAAHASGALAVGLEVGAYHYLRVRRGAQDADIQARQFIAMHRSLGCTLRPALDVEAQGNEGRTFAEYLSACRLFVAIVHAELGVTPLLYTYPGFWAGSTLLQSATDLAECPLWIAQYTKRLPMVPKPWKTKLLWQYAAGDGVLGTVPGVKGYVDRDKLFAPLSTLRV